MSIVEQFFGTVDIALDEEGFPTPATDDALNALRTQKNKWKAILWNKIPWGKSTRTRPPTQFVLVPMDSSSAVVSQFTIILEDQQIILPVLHFGLIKKFLMNFENASMSMELFETRYLVPAINDWDSVINLELLPAALSYFNKIFGTTKEKDIERYIDHNIIFPIADLQVANLANQSNEGNVELKRRFFLFCRNKFDVLPTPILNLQQLNYFIEPVSSFQNDLRGVGLALKPDYSIGYMNDIAFILPVGLGEIKSPLSALGETYEIIKEGSLTFLGQSYENIEFQTDGNNCVLGSSTANFTPSPDAMIKTFNNTTSKLISTMVHAGVPKGILSDYDNTIFIHLDEDFIVKDEASVFKIGNRTERRYIVEGNHILIKSTSTKLRAYIASFFWSSPETLLAQERFRNNVARWFGSHDTDQDVGGNEDTDQDVGGNEDTDQGVGGNEDPQAGEGPNEGSSRSTGNQPQFQQPRKDSDPGEGSSKRLKGSQGQILNRDTTLLKSFQKGLQIAGDKDLEEPGGSATPINTLETSYMGSDATSSADATLVNSSYEINTGMFTKIIPLEMEKLIYFYLKYDAIDYSSNPLISLKVVTVNLTKFINYLPAENKCLFQKDRSNILSQKARQRPTIGVLKVYDTTIERYQQHVEKCYHELKIYEKLSPGMGRFIPELYAAGLLYDKTIKIGVLYWRLNGPFMLIEHFTQMRNFDKSDVTKDIFEKEILPCFKFIHGLGVVHNDVKMENFVFTRKGLSRNVTCKLIDFSESFETDKKKYFDREIREVHETFKMPITN